MHMVLSKRYRQIKGEIIRGSKPYFGKNNIQFLSTYSTEDIADLGLKLMSI